MIQPAYSFQKKLAMIEPTTTPQPPAPLPRCYWVRAPRLLAGAYPGKPLPAEHQERVTQLFDAGMRTFINLMEEDETNPQGKPFVRYDDLLRSLAAERKTRIAHLRFPIRDQGIPTADLMRSILDAIDLSLAAGDPVYVHCFGGIGRTGTTIGCWLLRHGLTTPEDVLTMLAELRTADHERSSWASPENERQRDFVLDWAG